MDRENSLWTRSFPPLNHEKSLFDDIGCVTRELIRTRTCGEGVEWYGIKGEMEAYRRRRHRRRVWRNVRERERERRRETEGGAWSEEGMREREGDIKYLRAKREIRGTQSFTQFFRLVGCLASGLEVCRPHSCIFSLSLFFAHCSLLSTFVRRWWIISAIHQFHREGGERSLEAHESN